MCTSIKTGKLFSTPTVSPGRLSQGTAHRTAFILSNSSNATQFFAATTALTVDAADDVYANVSSGEAVIVYGGLSQAQAVSYSGKPATSDGQSDLTANTAGNDPAAQADPAAAQAAADAVNKAQSADARAQGADATAQAKAQADAQAQANAQVAQIAAQLQAAYMAQGMTPEQAAARAQADIAAAQAKAQAAAPAAGQ